MLYSSRSNSFILRSVKRNRNDMPSIRRWFGLVGVIVAVSAPLVVMELLSRLPEAYGGHPCRLQKDIHVATPEEHELNAEVE